MGDYITNANIMKRAIYNFSEKISAGTKRPFRKFTAGVCFGAMASKSCLLSEIVQALHEDTKKINTIERLARQLSAEIPDTVRANYTGIVRRYLPENTVVHIDNSDVIKPCGRAFEGISRVRDGSKSTESKTVLGNGYYVTEATVLTKTSHPVSVFSEVWSAESAAFTSGGEFAYTRKAIRSCTKQLGHVTFVMDRGYDDNAVFRLLEQLGQDYVIRVKLNRKVRINGKKHSI